jgi:hypothetical protein
MNATYCDAFRLGDWTMTATWTFIAVGSIGGGTTLICSAPEELTAAGFSGLCSVLLPGGGSYLFELGDLDADGDLDFILTDRLQPPTGPSIASVGVDQRRHRAVCPVQRLPFSTWNLACQALAGRCGADGDLRCW